MPFLSTIRPNADHTRDPTLFPWTLPLVRDLGTIDFPTPVTFLVGENGSGKSTLLEGLAAGMTAVAAGRRDLARDPSLAPARAFAAGFRFIRRRHARTRMFLRAEDVFGFTQRIGEDMENLASDAAELGTSIRGDYGRRLAIGAIAGQRGALARDYGENPDGRSHGETFLAVLRRRLVPNGLYFLDEPEAPLSPTRILALMALIAERVASGCQFIIATHSPILLAQPDATILLAENGQLQTSTWNNLEHVRITRAFLANPTAILRNVLP